MKKGKLYNYFVIRNLNKIYKKGLTRGNDGNIIPNMEGMKQSVYSALINLLRPLIKILLRNGIPCGTFCEIARWVYVDVASHEFGIQKRKQTASRVAVITGLSRKEVKRLREISASEDLSATDRYNRAVRVISGWRKDPHFINSKGSPRNLSLEDSEKGFSALVKQYSGDVPYRAVLDEMLNAGVVELHKNKVRLFDKGYIVKRNEIAKIHILGADVAELITTIGHNLNCKPEDSFFQRKVSYDNIPADLLITLRKQITLKNENFIEAMDKLISQYDRDVNPSVKGDGSKKAGIGLFYFE